MRRSKRLQLLSINDCLPIEMLNFIFKYLNYQSLANLKRVCKRWKWIIENLGSLRDAWKILVSLSQILLWHQKCA